MPLKATLNKRTSSMASSCYQSIKNLLFLGEGQHHRLTMNSGQCLLACLWLGPLMLDEEKKERKSAKAFHVKVDLKVELCEIIQERVGEWGQGRSKAQ